MGPAHKRRQMKRPFWHELPERAGIVSAVDDAEDRFMLLELPRQVLPGAGLGQAIRHQHLDPLELFVELQGVFDDLYSRRKPLEVEGRRTVLTQSRLGRGAEHERHPVPGHRLPQGVEDGVEKLRRQELGLVENHHTPDDAVELPAPASAARKERLEELYRCRDNNGRVPVLAGEAGPWRLFGLVSDVQNGVMFDDRFTEYATKLIRRLLDDARVGDNVEHPASAVLHRVVQGEGHG